MLPKNLPLPMKVAAMLVLSSFCFEALCQEFHVRALSAAEVQQVLEKTDFGQESARK